jgi:hypothetical protein
VEAHRWSRQRPDFGSSNALFRARSRVVHKGSVSESLKYRKTFSSDQGAIWSEVAMTLTELGAKSTTADFQAGREKVSHRMEDFVSTLRPGDCQVGAVFIGHRGLLGCEWLASPDLFKRAFEKIVRSFAFEALNTEKIPAALSAEVQKWWNSFLAAGTVGHDSPGEGEDIRIETDQAIGSGLSWKGGLLHFSCFPRDM